MTIEVKNESWEDTYLSMDISTDLNGEDIESTPKPDNQEPISTEPIITKEMVKEKYDRLRRNYTLKGYRHPQGVDKNGKYLF
jgi:hypothetical protein